MTPPPREVVAMLAGEARKLYRMTEVKVDSLGIGNLWHVARQGKPPGGPGRFVYLQHLQVQLIMVPTGCSSPLQANGGCGKRRRPRDVLAATFTSGSCNWPNLQMRQVLMRLEILLGDNGRRCRYGIIRCRREGWPRAVGL
ncbi:hypothetical protein UY3_04792 [Chelonia mydas]|uniref:Uncharacterized protein n=1 Tax=Chelonia mydas TaxID=8469 RepID=M7C0Z0_CHEMY|nr:hypothetical protein UY3_04792 [Chelonia mydas]